MDDKEFDKQLETKLNDALTDLIIERIIPIADKEFLQDQLDTYPDKMDSYPGLKEAIVRRLAELNAQVN